MKRYLNSKLILFIILLLMQSDLSISQNVFFRPHISSNIYTATTSIIADSVINAGISTVFTKTLSANQRFVVSNIVSGQTIEVAVTNTASNYTVTWVTEITWQGGVTPTQTIGAKTDIYTLKKIGSIIYGVATQDF